jgi:hypothetical protein
MGSLKSETVKYGREYQGTRTEERPALARASSTSKRQTHPLVREGDPRNQERNCQTYSVFRTEKKNLVVIPGWVLYTKTDWPTDRRS